jgi:hypothetical protein
MLRKILVVLILALLFAGVGSSTYAIERVGRSYGVLDVGAGYLNPVGSYEGFWGYPFLDEFSMPITENADQVYDNTYGLHLSVGQLRNKWMARFGLGYTKIKYLHNFLIDDNIRIHPNLHQFDIYLSVNRQFLDIQKSSFTPSVGLKFGAGLAALKSREIETDYRGNVFLSLEFGAELKLLEFSNHNGFMTLVSANSYDILASNDRPKYLQIGALLRFYARP